MSRLWNGKALLSILLVVALWMAARQIDWSGPPRPPANPVALQNECLRELDFTINGRNAVEQKLAFPAWESVLLDVSYTREPVADQTFDQIVILLVCDDGSETGKIETESFLGFNLKEEERPTREGLLEWRCPGASDGEGLRKTLMAGPGTYELRLCWKREPKTVSELAAQHEDPFRFLYPFCRAEIDLTEGSRAD